MTKLRTTFTPGRVVDVEDGEFIDLKRQGLIHSHEPIDKENSFIATQFESVASPKRWEDGDVVETPKGDLSTNASDDKKKGA